MQALHSHTFMVRIVSQAFSTDVMCSYTVWVGRSNWLSISNRPRQYLIASRVIPAFTSHLPTSNRNPVDHYRMGCSRRHANEVVMHDNRSTPYPQRTWRGRGDTTHFPIRRARKIKHRYSTLLPWVAAWERSVHLVTRCRSTMENHHRKSVAMGLILS